MRHPLPPLTSEATLRDLSLQYFQVDPATLGRDVAHQFELERWLPGVIVADKANFLGMISRRRFNEWMSSPYGVDILLDRPIAIFLELSQQSNQVLQLPETETVTSALEQALDRSVDDIYEPIVVTSLEEALPNQPMLFLLEFQTLVQAQTRISRQAQDDLSRHRQTLNRYMQQFSRAQTQIKQYEAQLQIQQLSSGEVVQPIVLTAEEYAEYQNLHQRNEQLVETARSASQASQQAFQGTLDGVSVMVGSAQDVVEIGQFLTIELTKVQSSSQTIRRISEQIRYLAMQATIAVNQPETKLVGLSQITNEIGQMIHRTVEAGRELDIVATRLTHKLSHLSQSAQAGMQAARSLIRKIQQAELAVSELAKLAPAVLTAEPIATNGARQPAERDRATGIQVPELTQKITQLEQTLAELAQFVRHQDAGHLVRKIQRALSTHRQQQGLSSEEGSSRS
jgi:hypothetical protein